VPDNRATNILSLIYIYRFVIFFNLGNKGVIFLIFIHIVLGGVIQSADPDNAGGEFMFI
jgi:hypothetical protein